MRYLPHFFGITLVLLAVIAALPAMAEQKDGMGEAVLMQLQTEEPGEPWEHCWWERSWDSWRHLDGGALDAAAVRFMGHVHTVAILPFEDFTTPSIEGDSALARAGGPRRIVDNLAAELMARGYLVIPPSDVDAALALYAQGEDIVLESEVANNSWYFQVLSEGSINYSFEKVFGLADQYDRLAAPAAYLTNEDIRNLGEALGADCVIRGFVNEYAVTRDIDADLRTFLPPFLGLLNPDRRATLQVAYYIYDGHSGELVWNGTTEVREDAEWPVFHSESELLRETEAEVVRGMTGRILPSWERLLWGHPEWVPLGRRHGFGPPCGEGVHYPDWLNPMRQGWHREYHRHSMRLDGGRVEGEPYKYDGLIHNYNGIRHYPGGSPDE